jgi:hypothetical protein
MTTTTDNQTGQTAEEQEAQPSYFEAKPVPGRALFNKGPAKFEVTPNDGHGDVTVGDVTVYGTGMGVQVERPEEPAEGQQPDLSVRISADCQTAFAYNATLKQTDNDGPVSVITGGKVILVNPALASSESTETGIQLSISAYGITGKLDGTVFDIDPSEKDGLAVEARRIEVIPTAEASKNETDTHLRISAAFNRAVVEGLHVKVRIEIENGQAVIHTAHGVMIKAEPEAKMRPLLDISGDVTRLTLVGGKVFDINTANGDVTAYVGKKGIRNEGPPELAEPATESADDHQITISQDNKRIALNGAGLEKSAEGALVAATDGVGRLMPPEKATLEIGDRPRDKEGWIYAGVSPDTGEDMFVAPEDSGIMTFAEAEKAVEELREQGIDARIPSQGELSMAFNPEARVPGLERGTSFPKDWYWSSTEGGSETHLCARGGEGFIYNKNSRQSSLRIMRN